VSVSDERAGIPLGWSPLDRAGERRQDPEFLDRARSDPESRLLVVADHTRVPVAPGGGLDWQPLGPDAGVALGPDAGVAVGPDAGVALADEVVFLGVDEAGRALFSRDAQPDEVDDRFVSLRDVGADLDPVEAAAALEAAGVSAWHRKSRFCPNCGSPTTVADAGHRRRCAACGTGHFPRTDPAVIMLVTAGDHCVLGRRPGAPAGRWSTMAGFVEAGESLEAAVAREVWEEVGVAVTATRYRGSQPWPFPASLMVAFEADADFGPLTGNEEHLEVRWFERGELRRAMANGEVTPPGPISAGGYLIRSWLD
jgi:NAD+ diphosphatase